MMSIRAEDAAAEASRFSLRTSFFGVENTAPQLTFSTSQPPQPPPQLPQLPQPPQPPRHSWNLQFQKEASQAQPPNIATNGLSFNSLMSSKCNASTLQNSQIQSTIAAISMISQKQREKSALFQMKPDVSGTSDSNRTLPSGYLSGGNQTRAEVMRLSATIDTLNSKISSQNDRLQRTEASLVRANRLITSERATSNARLLNMQNDMKMLRERGELIREQAIAQTRRESQKSSISFENSVKLSQQRENAFNELSSRVKELTNERNSLVDAAAQSAKESETRLSSIGTENSNLVEKLSTISAQYESTKSQLEDLLMSERTETDSSTLAQSALDIEAKLLNEVNLLKEQNDELQMKIDKLATEATSAPSTQTHTPAPTPTMFCECDSRVNPETTLYHSKYDSKHDYEDVYNDEDDLRDKPKQKVLFDKQPQILRSRCPSAACHPVTLRISSRMKREGHGTRLGISSINPMFQYRLTRATFGSSKTTMSTGADATAPPMPEHVRALIEAVSKDISSACIRKRRAYLTAAGVASEEIDSELKMYM